MAIEATESPSPRLRTHLVGYLAATPNGEQYRLARIPSAGGRPTQAERTAALPEHLRSEYIATQLDGNSAPIVLGPAATEQDHPAWCTDHYDEIGDGTALCSSESVFMDEGDVTAFLQCAAGEAPRVSLSVDSDGARLSLTAARELIAALSNLVEQAETAVTL